MEKGKIIISVIIACFLSAVVAGCNIFGFLHPATPDLSTGTIDEHIAQGRKLLNAADYAGAAKEFQYAIDKGTAAVPQDNVTDAYYYHAVAYSRDRDVDALAVILTMVSALGSTEKTSLLEGFNNDQINDIYYASDVARDDLWEVYDSSDDTTFRHIEIRFENVYFDLTMSSILKVVARISMLGDIELAYENGNIVWTSTPTVDQINTVKTDIEDSRESIKEMSVIIGEDTAIGQVLGGFDSFFDTELSTAP